MSKPEANYFQILDNVISQLPENSGAARRVVYAKARNAIVSNLKSYKPALSPSDITNEQLRLEDAIRKIEAQCMKQSRGQLPPDAALEQTDTPTPKDSIDRKAGAPATSLEAQASDRIMTGHGVIRRNFFAHNRILLAALAIFLVFLGSVALYIQNYPAILFSNNSEPDSQQAISAAETRDENADSTNLSALPPPSSTDSAALPTNSSTAEGNILESDGKDETRLPSLEQNSPIADDARQVDAVKVVRASPLETESDSFIRYPDAPAVTSAASSANDPPPLSGAIKTTGLLGANYFEIAGDQVSASVSAGDTAWSLIGDNETPGKIKNLTAQTIIPGQDLKIMIQLGPNSGPPVAASHIFDIVFLSLTADRAVEVAQPEALIGKSSEAGSGTALIGNWKTISNTHFQFILSAEPKMLEQNLELMSRMAWLDVLLQKADEKAATISVELGTQGIMMLAEALDQWDAS